MAGHPRPIRVGMCWVEMFGLLKEAKCGIHGYHFLVVREVGVDRSVERECDG